MFRRDQMHIFLYRENHQCRSAIAANYFDIPPKIELDHRENEPEFERFKPISYSFSSKICSNSKSWLCRLLASQLIYLHTQNTCLSPAISTFFTLMCRKSKTQKQNFILKAPLHLLVVRFIFWELCSQPLSKFCIFEPKLRLLVSTFT